MDEKTFRASDLISVNSGIARALENNRRALELVAIGGGVAKIFADNQRAIDLFSKTGGIAKALEQNRRAIELMNSGGIAKAIAKNQRAMDLIFNGGIAKALEKNRQALDYISSSGGVAKAMMDNQRAINMISTNCGIARALEKNRPALEMVGSGSSIAKIFSENRSSISSVIERLSEQRWYESAAEMVEDELNEKDVKPDHEVTSASLSAELESLSKADNSESFLKLFSKLPIFIRLLLLFSILEVILPQINSISANFITPHVERYLSNDDMSPREKVKKIESMPLMFGEYDLEGLRFISRNDVHLREGPNTKSEIIDALEIGRVIILLHKDRRWSEVRVQYEDGVVEEGWVHSRYVRKFKTKANNGN
ncbi:MAG: SH3 domain-containing protein [Gammaproteobacteria bacterium]|nr:SH3 domain-containing protein [Gammaproteobacteria bacterium]